MTWTNVLLTNAPPPPPLEPEEPPEEQRAAGPEGDTSDDFIDVARQAASDWSNPNDAPDVPEDEEEAWGSWRPTLIGGVEPPPTQAPQPYPFDHQWVNRNQRIWRN